jgi:steroid 5-alpha reductase family enzyme
MPHAAATGLAATLTLGMLTWLASLWWRDVSIVDRVWSWLFVAAAATYSLMLPHVGPRAAWLWPLLLAWAVRLSAHITRRSWRQPEDRRYQAIRARNQPGFALKSLWLVFGLQALLAWLYSAPLLAALASPRRLGWLDAAGVLLCAFGIVFEAVADGQLSRFQAGHNHGRVLDTGLWRWSRHPNYFGEACAWWGFWLIALAAGGGWTVFAPLMLTAMLLKVSGVSLLEKDIGERRPAYRDYIARTNAFIPGPRKAPR